MPDASLCTATNKPTRSSCCCSCLSSLCCFLASRDGHADRATAQRLRRVHHVCGGGAGAVDGAEARGEADPSDWPAGLCGAVRFAGPCALGVDGVREYGRVSGVLGFVFFLKRREALKPRCQGYIGCTRVRHSTAASPLAPPGLFRACVSACVRPSWVRRCFVRFEVLLNFSLVLVRFGHPLVSFGTQYFVTIRTTIPTFSLITTRPSAAQSQRLSIHRLILRVGSIPAYSIALAERSWVLER